MDADAQAVCPSSRESAGSVESAVFGSWIQIAPGLPLKSSEDPAVRILQVMDVYVRVNTPATRANGTMASFAVLPDPSVSIQA